jgi:MFS family permease
MQDAALLSPAQRLRSLVALNAVSTLAQVGQYGLGTSLLPLAQEARGVPAWLIGLSSAAFWFGMLAGLLLAGRATRAWGYRRTVVAGMLLSAAAFGLTPALPPAAWGLPAAAIGMGLGLRWIANETWLYRMAPAQSRGRIVGLHETLIGLAAIAGPMLVAATGVQQALPFWLGSLACLLAVLPLGAATLLSASPASIEGAATTGPAPAAVASEGPVVSAAARSSSGAAGGGPAAAGGHRPAAPSQARQWSRRSLALLAGVSLGAWLAGLGGWIEGGLLALLPVYATDQGLSSTEAAWLLTLLGVGATACQLPIGWLADVKGGVWTARLGTALAGAATLLVLTQPAAATLAVMALALGAVTGGLLTLGMVFASSGADGAAITARVRQVSITYTTLSGIGPLVAGAVVSQSGHSGALMVLQLGLVLALAWLLRPAGQALAGQR